MSLSPVAGAILRSDIAGVIEDATGAEENLIGLQVAPAIGFDEKSGQYPRLRIESGRMLAPDDAKRRGPTSNYARKTRRWEMDTYTTEEYGLENPLGYDTINDLSRFFDAETSVARLTRLDLLLSHEKRIADTIINTTNFAAITSGVAYSTTNAGTIDLGLDVDNAKEAIRKRGESVAPQRLKVVIPAVLYPLLRSSALLQKRVFGHSRAQDIRPLTPEELATALEVSQVLIGRAVYNSAKEGKDAVLTDLWPKTHIWVGQVNEGDNLMAGGAARTIFWRRNSNLVQVETYDQPEINSLIIRVRQDTDEKVVNANTGQLITTQAP